MLDQQLINEIEAALTPAVPFSFFICDTSGRVVASNALGELQGMNLDAIMAINEDRMVCSPPHGEARDCAVPLRHEDRFVGALVVQGDHDVAAVNILKTGIELLYAEKLRAKDEIRQHTLVERFRQAWLQRREPYDRDFAEQGSSLGIDVESNHQVLVVESARGGALPSGLSRKLLDAHDFILADTSPLACVVLRENRLLHQKINRLLAVLGDCKVGVGSLGDHLYGSYAEARQSLEVGKALFPGEHAYRHERLELAISIAAAGVSRRLSRTFALLVDKGHAARLARTAVAYMQHNGNIAEVCGDLHIHRNSIQYRLAKIQELCGRDLRNYHDMLHLYASYISYRLEHGAAD